MRMPIRTKVLAAGCAWLLLSFGSIAQAGPPGKPIPIPVDLPSEPVRIGDPDQPTGGIVIVLNQWVFTLRVPVWGRIQPASRSGGSVVPERCRVRGDAGKGRNAR